MKLYALPTKIKILRASSNSKENRKSNDGATAPRQIYLFPKSCRRVQFSRYQGRQKQSKNRKLTKSSMKTKQFIFFTQLFGRVQLYKILSRQATQRKIGNLTTERPLLGRFIFFHRVVGMFSFQDTNH